MKKIFIAMIVMFMLLLSSCSSNETDDIISQSIGIDTSSGTEVSTYDTHGGFHGDGTLYIALSFSDDNVLEQIKKSNWKQFPLDETTAALVYGISNNISTIGPYLTDDSGNKLVPEIKNGYYILIDRQTENDENLETNILDRASFNFTLALYDTDTNILYFCQLDT